MLANRSISTSSLFRLDVYSIHLHSLIQTDQQKDDLKGLIRRWKNVKEKVLAKIENNDTCSLLEKLLSEKTKDRVHVTRITKR